MGRCRHGPFLATSRCWSPHVSPAGEGRRRSGDATPPTTLAFGGDDLWHNLDVTLTFTASNESDGSGVAATYYAVDAAQYAIGTSVTIPAPADHTNDGAHPSHYRDTAGNVEAPQTRIVVDPGPVTELAAAGGAAGVASPSRTASPI
jgi:hypothetical protein